VSIVAPRYSSALRHPALLWGAFLAAHAWLIWLSLTIAPDAVGDVAGVYRYWMDGLLSGSSVVGITVAWVYPLGALAPMYLATLAGMQNFVVSWLVLVTVLDLITFAILIRGAHRPAPRAIAAWWWIAALVALGPITLGRIDSVVTPFAILGLLVVLTRPALGGVLLAIGAWLKVWPAAMILAAVILIRRRGRLLGGALALSVAIIAIGLALGAGPNLFSFIGYQGSRGLQIEAPAATPFLWLAALGDPATRVYFDDQLLTYQVSGPGVDSVAAASTWVMGAAVLTTLGTTAWRARSSFNGLRYLPAVSLALVMALIAFNKVGSPQYFCWLIPPVLLGLLVDRARFLAVALVCLAAMALTQIVYPWIYTDVVNTQPVAVAVLTLRNVLEVVLFVWMLGLLVRRR
jgi:hypothetical protein